MYLHAGLLVFSTGLVTAGKVQRRGFPSIRPARVDPEADSPTMPIYHSSSDDVPYIGSTTHVGSDTAEGATPEYQPATKPNECLREECAELTVELAKEVINQMVDNLQGSSSSFTTTSARAYRPMPTAHAAASPMPNFNVAKRMTLDQDSLALFDGDEQDMYFHDRMCFYANVERLYASVATESPSPTRLTGRDIPSRAPSQVGGLGQGAPSQVGGLGQDAGTQVGGLGQQTASPTPLAPSDAAYYQEALWNTYMPERILSIYAPMAANGSITTATTTCSGLGNAPSITMSFVEVRATHSPTPTSNDHMVTGAADVQSKAGGSAIFGGVVALVGLIVL